MKNLLGLAALIALAATPALARTPATPSQSDPERSRPTVDAAPDASKAEPTRGRIELPPEVAASLARTPLVTRAVDPAFRGSTAGEGFNASSLLREEFRASRGSALYAQPVVPAEAVVATVDGEERLLPLAVSGPIESDAAGNPVLPADPARRAFCDTREREDGRIACYRDADGDGQFETLLHGITRADHNPLAIVSLVEAKGLDPRVRMPIAYRAATDGELPVHTLRYNSCDPDSDLPTYAVHLDVAGDADIAGDRCTSLAEAVAGPAGGARRVRVDRVVLELLDTEAGTATRIVEPIPAGTLLDRIGGRNEVFLLGERPSPIEELAGRLVEMTQRPVYSLRDAPRIVNRQGEEGDVVLLGYMQYGYTGRLIQDAESSGFLGLERSGLEAGQPVYGVPLQSQQVSTFNNSVISRRTIGPPRMYWCAPYQFREVYWRADCFLSGDVAHRVYRRVSSAFMIRTFAGESVETDPIRIEEGPADFGDIEVRYRFEDWRDDTLVLQFEVGPGRILSQDRMNIGVRRSADGSAQFVLGDGEYRIVPVDGDDGYRIEELRAPTGGGPLYPLPSDGKPGAATRAMGL